MTDRIQDVVDSEGALLATVLDQTHDCIKLLDLNGVIKYVNPQGALAMELTSPGELLGEQFVSRWPEEVQPLIDSALAAASRGQLGRFHASGRNRDGGISWWDVSVSPVRAQSGAITHFATIAREMTSEVLERQRVEAISVEMRHRLKNALTVAGGIVMLSARGQPEVQSFASSVLERFNQLAKVEALVLDPGSDKRLVQIVSLLTGAYGENAAVTFGTLPDVQLSHEAMQALALCFGELITNSLKYGALRNGNRIFVDGVSEDDLVELTWREETDLGPARQGGQGLGLIERLIRTAGGTFKREAEPSEIRVIMRLPVIKRDS